MKRIFTFIAVLGASSSFAQNDVAFSASENWIAYMNVFDLPANGGAYQFGSSWALADTKSTLDVGANTLTLQPNFNTYADNISDPYWVDQSTQLGNKDMEALTFVEPASLNGSDLTFHGDVISFTLDTNIYAAQFFIKALDPNNGYADALGGSKVFDLPASGPFTVSATAAELPAGLIIQYGFIIRGRNANPANEVALGSVVVGIDDAGMNELNAVSTRVYPNPTSDLLTIEADAEIESFEISSLFGQMVAEGTSVNGLDVSSLESGMYIITVHTKDGIGTTRFTKK